MLRNYARKCYLKGPTAILNNSLSGAKIYGSTTGPYCKVEEVSNCVFFGYSSKLMMVF